MTAWINPLDIERLLVNTFAGNRDIFMFIAFIAIMALAAMFRMPNSIALIMFALFGIIMSMYTSSYFILIVIFAGFAIFAGLKKVFER